MIKDVIILALDKRKHLWDTLYEDCISRGWNTKLFVVGDGLDKTVKYDHVDLPLIEAPLEWKWGTGIGALRHYNAFHSHKKIIQYAIRKKMPNFLLLEDDTYPLNRFNEVMDCLDKEIECTQIDLLYLGWHAFDFDGDYAIGYNLELERLWKEEGQCRLMPANFNVGGFHAVAINENIYTTLLNCPAIAPIDCQCNRIPWLKRYLVTPKIFHVKNTFSYCENKEVIREIL